MQMKTSDAVGAMFEGQLQHLLLLACLLPGAMFVAWPALDGSVWLGISDRTWFFATLAIVVGHQVIGWFVFRTQLLFSLFSRLLGEYDFVAWGMIFFPFLVMRPLSTLALGLADQGSLQPLHAWQTVLALVLLVPAIYTGWSIERYFGFARALGGDHFRQKYRDLPLVRQGAFKYSSNAMYAFAFLSLWSLALFTHSQAALAAALFQHAYIWVHMYCTEGPDMRRIYGGA